MNNIISERKDKLQREADVAFFLLKENLVTMTERNHRDVQQSNSINRLSVGMVLNSLSMISKMALSKNNKIRKGLVFLNYGFKISKAIK